MFYELCLTFNATLHEELKREIWFKRGFVKNVLVYFIAKWNYSEYIKYKIIQVDQVLLSDAMQLSSQNLEPAIWRSYISVLL